MRARYWIGAASLTGAALLFGSLGASALLAPAVAAAPPPRVICKKIETTVCIDCPAQMSDTCRSTCSGPLDECSSGPVGCDPNNIHKVCEQIISIGGSDACPNC